MPAPLRYIHGRDQLVRPDAGSLCYWIPPVAGCFDGAGDYELVLQVRRRRAVGTHLPGTEGKQVCQRQHAGALCRSAYAYVRVRVYIGRVLVCSC